jgi:hypothetical protein
MSIPELKEESRFVCVPDPLISQPETLLVAPKTKGMS